MPKVSICMSSYNRPEQLRHTLESIRIQSFRDFEVVLVDDGDDGLTEGVCAEFRNDFPVQCFNMGRTQRADYKCAARVNNAAVRRSSGEIIILQNPECKHVSPEVIKTLTDLVDDGNAVFARCVSLNQDGIYECLYSGEEFPRPLFFCGAMQKRWFEELRGFDEDFTHYGFEDDDFARRLEMAGVRFEFTDDVVVHHQYHLRCQGNICSDINGAIFGHKQHLLKTGLIGIKRNLGRDWGTLGEN